jgi:hypothetical protein
VAQKNLNILMDKTKLYLVVGLLFCFVIIVLVITMFHNQNSPTPNDTNNTTMTPTAVSTGAPVDALQITTSDPLNNATNIPVTQIITLNLAKNRTISPADLNVTIEPTTPFTIGLKDSAITITPKSALKPGIPYLIQVIYKGDTANLYSLTFRTVGPTATPVPNTRDEKLIQDINQSDKTNNPDVYLSNQTPYQTSDFSIDSVFKKEPTGHYGFIVKITSNDQDGTKAKLLEWIRSTGLSDTQIQTLDITYQ